MTLHGARAATVSRAKRLLTAPLVVGAGRISWRGATTLDQESSRPKAGRESRVVFVQIAVVVE